eukprot:TRINITY_DN15270_c0_g1_i1.p1 TRINITY_DN15270_c0_g1~~TRINITY_DN15270_c0_g1_i1.p1  ORF type:complete len:109 (+),score=19.52 TRINITY_DN15270_c0_g1_i1:108-434(+)
MLNVELIRYLVVGWKSIAHYLPCFDHQNIVAIENQNPRNLVDQAEAFLYECTMRTVKYAEFLAALEGTNHQLVADFLRRSFALSTTLVSQGSGNPTPQVAAPLVPSAP